MPGSVEYLRHILDEAHYVIDQRRGLDERWIPVN